MKDQSLDTVEITQPRIYGVNLSVAFIAVSFLLTLNDSLDNLHSVLGTDHFKAECDKLFSCFSAQLLVQGFQLRMVAVDVGFIHILEDVVHFVVSALLAGCLIVSCFHLDLCLQGEYPKNKGEKTYEGKHVEDYCPKDEEHACDDFRKQTDNHTDRPKDDAQNACEQQAEGCAQGSMNVD